MERCGKKHFWPERKREKEKARQTREQESKQRWKRQRKGEDGSQRRSYSCGDLTVFQKITSSCLSLTDLLFFSSSWVSFAFRSLCVWNSALFFLCFSFGRSFRDASSRAQRQWRRYWNNRSVYQSATNNRFAPLFSILMLLPFPQITFHSCSALAIGPTRTRNELIPFLDGLLAVSFFLPLSFHMLSFVVCFDSIWFWQWRSSDLHCTAAWRICRCTHCLQLLFLPVVLSLLVFVCVSACGRSSLCFVLAWPSRKACSSGRNRSARCCMQGLSADSSSWSMNFSSPLLPACSQVVASLKKLIPRLPSEDILQKSTLLIRRMQCMLSVSFCRPDSLSLPHFHSFLVGLAEGEWFTNRVSACALFACVYPLVPPAFQDDSRKLFARLAADESPMVRKAAFINMEVCSVALFPNDLSLWIVGPWREGVKIR